MSRLEQPVCIPCGQLMRCEKNNFLVTTSSKLHGWRVDRYECPQCNASVATGSSEGHALDNYDLATPHQIALNDPPRETLKFPTPYQDPGLPF